MKINYTTKNERINATIETESVKDAFKKLAEFQEVFDEQYCGLCESEDIHFLVRNVDNNDYYELKCRKCGAKLAFGQNKNGSGIFPKRKLEDGNYDFKHKGWHKWTPDK